MIDCDKSMERKEMRKVVDRKKGVERKDRKERKKDRGVKTFHSLRVTSPMHTRTTTALECGHFSSYYF